MGECMPDEYHCIDSGMGGAQIQVCEADCTWGEFSEPLPFGLGCDELGEVP
jgi:hypothetical protein